MREVALNNGLFADGDTPQQRMEGVKWSWFPSAIASDFINEVAASSFECEEWARAVLIDFVVACARAS